MSKKIGAALVAAPLTFTLAYALSYLVTRYTNRNMRGERI